MTPFGAPVVPLVYIKTAMSVGFGGRAAMGLRAPSVATSSSPTWKTFLGNLSNDACSGSPIVTTCLSDGQSPATFVNVFKSFPSHTTTLALV